MAEPKRPEPPKYEKYHAERLKCKEPKRRIARSEPVRKAEPEGSTTEEEEDDDNSLDHIEPVVLAPRSSRSRPLRAVAQPPRLVSSQPSPPSPDNLADLDLGLDLEPQPVARKPRRFVERPQPVEDLSALRDKYRPKKPAQEPASESDDFENDTKASPEQPKTGTILLEPIRPPTPPMEEIKAEPIQPVYVEMRKPLKRRCTIFSFLQAHQVGKHDSRLT